MKKTLENFPSDTLFQLVRRHILIYFRDKALIFFSVLSPLILLMLYVVFLGDVQISSIKGAIPEGVTLTDKAIKGFVDSWMIAGVLGVSCITVSLNAMSVMVGDRERNIISDFKAAPVQSWLVQISYFIANFIITMAIALIILAASLAYLGISGTFTLSIDDIFDTLRVLVLSVLSSTACMAVVARFFRTESSYGGFGGMVSAVLGFFIGAYMPISIFPKPVQYIANLIPGSHSAALFRNSIMRGAYQEILNQTPEMFAKEIASAYSMRLNMFGTEIPTYVMNIYLVASIVLFIGLNILLSKVNLEKRLPKKPLKIKNKAQ